jgi:predicted amidophosphoribosyltransferase
MNLFSDLRSAIQLLLCGYNVCLLCGQKGSSLCARCQEQLWYDDSGKFCSSCGKLLISTVDCCLVCRETPLLIPNVSLGPYLGLLKELLHQIKYGDCSELFPWLAAELASRIRFEYPGTVVVPVPSGRTIKRLGYDPVQELCVQMFSSNRIPYELLLEHSGLGETKSLKGGEREAFAASSFSLKSKPVNGPYILFDDICTTGSTLRSCARLFPPESLVGSICLAKD